MNIFKILALIFFIGSPLYSMEELGHIVKNDRAERQETVNERVESICNGLIGKEYLAIEAYNKCIKGLKNDETTINKARDKRDACILQSIVYECLLRKQMPIKIEEDNQ